MFSLWGGSSELQKKADATLDQLNAVRAELVRSEAGRQRLRVALADQPPRARSVSWSYEQWS